MHRTHDIGRDRIGSGCLCNTEIRDLDLALFGNHDILWFDVSVNDVIVMCRLNPHGYLNGDTECFLHGKTCFLFNIIF